MNMMETMLRNPEMQKMLYPYLPEPMRNPSSIEWMLSNPEVKKQMASMFEQQASHRGTETQAGGDNAAFHYSSNNVDRVLMLFGLDGSSEPPDNLLFLFLPSFLLGCLQNMMSPQMMDMMKGMDFNQSKVNQQVRPSGISIPVAMHNFCRTEVSTVPISLHVPTEPML